MIFGFPSINSSVFGLDLGLYVNSWPFVNEALAARKVVILYMIDNII